MDLNKEWHVEGEENIVFVCVFMTEYENYFAHPSPVDVSGLVTL